MSRPAAGVPGEEGLAIVTDSSGDPKQRPKVVVKRKPKNKAARKKVMDAEERFSRNEVEAAYAGLHEPRDLKGNVVWR